MKYTDGKKNITTNSIYNQDYTTLNQLYNPNYSQWITNLSIDKKVKPLKSRIKWITRYNKTQSANYFNGNHLKYNSKGFYTKVSWLSMFKKEYLSFDAGFEYKHTLLTD